jgi:hypothetical protein
MAMLDACRPVPEILAVRPTEVNACTRFLALAELTLVDITVGKCVRAIAVHFSVLKMAFVSVPVFPNQGPLADTFAVGVQKACIGPTLSVTYHSKLGY